MWKLIKRDLVDGTKTNIFKFIILALFCFLVCHRFHKIVNNMYVSGAFTSNSTSVFDYFFLIFGGMKKYVPENNKYFELPVIWMTVQMLLLSLVFSYPEKDLSNNGYNILLRCGSRRKWWLSKLMWGIIQILLGYLVILIVIGIYAMVSGTGEIILHKEYLQYYYGADIISNSFKMDGLMGVLIYGLGISVLHMTFSMIISPLISAIGIIVYDVLSAYIMSPFLIGNISMLLRNVNYVDDGIKIVLTSLCFLIISIIVFWISIEIFNRLDILGRRIAQED